MTPFEIRFAVDRMLGRLARMLRLLGYDALYANNITTAQLLALARSGERVILTRGETARRFPDLDNVVSLKSEYPPEQFREAVERFGLDTISGRWTRCILCNAPIERVEKVAVEGLVDAPILRLYEEFWRCPRCGKIYWRGSHVDRIVKNLDALLGREAGPHSGSVD